MIRDVKPSDADALVALNLESEHFLSPMDRDRLAELERQAACRLVIEQDSGVAAFLLAFREGADYDSANYRWFAVRYDRFLYIDRVVVGAAHRRLGHASRLYRAAFDAAARDGVELVACEYDVEPINEASRRFHDAFGFREVGRQTAAGGAKQVSMQLARVEAVPVPA